MKPSREGLMSHFAFPLASTDLKPSPKSMIVIRMIPREVIWRSYTC